MHKAGGCLLCVDDKWLTLCQTLPLALTGLDMGKVNSAPIKRAEQTWRLQKDIYSKDIMEILQMIF